LNDFVHCRQVYISVFTDGATTAFI
jgi:hypothetical protein